MDRGSHACRAGKGGPGECECVGESDGIRCDPLHFRHNMRPQYRTAGTVIPLRINMRRILGLLLVLGLGATGAATAAEYNPVSSYPVSVGPEMHRIIVGFR